MEEYNCLGNTLIMRTIRTLMMLRKPSRQTPPRSKSNLSDLSNHELTGFRSSFKDTSVFDKDVGDTFLHRAAVDPSLPSNLVRMLIETVPKSMKSTTKECQRYIAQ